MAEDNRTLDTFYENWKLYQDHLKAAIAPLTNAQLALRAAPHLGSIDQLASHIIGVRIGWFTYTLGENTAEAGPDEHWGGKDWHAHSAAELVQGLDATWKMMADRLARWSSADMLVTFDDEDDQGNKYKLSRSWIIWHLIEHDLHHGGEISLTLGIHGLQAPNI